MIAVSQLYTNQLEVTRSAASLENVTLIVTGKHVEIMEETVPPPYTTATLLEDACDGYFTHPFEFPSNGDARRKRPGNHGETPWMSQVTRGQKR